MLKAIGAIAKRMRESKGERMITLEHEGCEKIFKQVKKSVCSTKSVLLQNDLVRAHYIEAPKMVCGN